jgi:DNA-binding NtrC family response regulator
MEAESRLPAGDYLLGRAIPCHILLQDRTVSSEHCRLWQADGRWYIQDSGSTNGTLLDGTPLIPRQAIPLPRSCRIRLGIISLSLDWDEEGVNKPSPPRFPLILIAQHEETSTINAKTLSTQFVTASRNKASQMGLLSQNPKILRLYEEARDLAVTRLPIAIEGETGVGKELLTKYIHQISGRRGALITLVPTTSEALQESEFFGYKKGAFTGADRDYPGKIKLADQGTLFLDELSHIPQTLQVRLLRFLENGEIFPLGARLAETVDVRLVVASNVPFKQLIRDRVLRDDFFYRLCNHTLTVPPLRERREDILPLFTHFFLQGEAEGEPVGLGQTIPLEVGAALTAHTWPGNIRELKAEAQRLRLKVSAPHLLKLSHLSPAILSPDAAAAATPPNLTDRDVYERKLIHETLEACLGNKSLAAERLKISRRGLYKKMKRLRMGE